MKRRDFLQYLGIGGMIAAVHNVDALGVSTIEKKLIVPNYGWVRIYAGGTPPEGGRLLATLEMKGPLIIEEIDWQPNNIPCDWAAVYY